MSILFPKVNKMPEWNYRPVYYDPEKEARKEKLAQLQAKRNADENGENSSKTDYVPTLRRGSFREAHEQNLPSHKRAAQGSKLAFWIALLSLLIFCFYYLL